MATEIGTGYVSVVPSAAGFGAKLAAQTVPAAAIAGRKTAAAMSAPMIHAGKSLTKWVTLPFIALGAVALLSAKKIDDARAKISYATGATGKELDDLTQSMRNVARHVPQGFDDIAIAIGEVGTRLGLTGDDLESVTKKMLDLARVTGTDVGTTVSKVTRVFGDWSVSTQDQSSALDKLTVATQQSGIGLDELSSLAVQWGAPMREIGFTLDDTLALFGKWEREGVNTTTVMGGLRIGLGNLASAGLDAKKAFPQVIEQIKNAGSSAEANKLSMETFGKRAGVDMARAIREGRFEIEDFKTALQNSDGALRSAAEQSLTFGERMDLTKNKLMLAGERIGNLLLPVLDKLADAVSWLAEKIAKIPSPILIVIGVLAGLAAAVGPVLTVVGKVIKLWWVFRKVLLAVQIAWLVFNGVFLASPLGLIIVAIVAVVAVLVLLWTKCEWFRNAVTAVWDAIKSAVSVVVSWFQETVWPVLKGVWDAIATAAREMWAILEPLWRDIWNAIKPVIDWIGTHIAPVLKRVWDTIVAGVKVLWKIWSTVWTAVWNVIKPVVAWIAAHVWPVLKKVFAAVVDSVRAMGRVMAVVWSAVWTVIKTVVGWIVQFVRQHFHNLKLIVTTVWGGIKTVITTAVNVIKRVIGTISAIVEKVRAIFTKVRDAIKDKIDRAVEVVTGLKDRVVGFFSKAATWLLSAGKDIVGGLIQGIKDVAGKVAQAIKDFILDKLPPFVRDKLEGHSPSRVFARLAHSIPEGLAAGITEASPAVEAAVGRMLRLTAIDPVSLAVRADAAALRDLAAAAPRTLHVDALGGAITGPSTLVVVDTDGKLIGRMRVEANHELSRVSEQLVTGRSW